MNTDKFLREFHDFLAPRLDPYEQAIYLYVVRHSRLLDQDDVVIGVAGAAKSCVFGTGNTGSSMAASQVFKKMRSLETKGCLKVVDTEHQGSRLRAFLPNEIDGLIPSLPEENPLSLEKMDFFNVPENRKLIVNRENHKCFYCLRKLNDENYVIEHVQSRPEGDCSFRNVVAACRSCNNRKGSSPAQDYLRTLYREGFLGESEFENRMSHLELLLAGKLKPEIANG